MVVVVDDMPSCLASSGIRGAGASLRSNKSSPGKMSLAPYTVLAYVVPGHRSSRQSRAAQKMFGRRVSPFCVVGGHGRRRAGGGRMGLHRAVVGSFLGGAERLGDTAASKLFGGVVAVGAGVVGVGGELHVQEEKWLGSGVIAQPPLRCVAAACPIRSARFLTSGEDGAGLGTCPPQLSWRPLVEGTHTLWWKEHTTVSRQLCLPLHTGCTHTHGLRAEVYGGDGRYRALATLRRSLGHARHKAYGRRGCKKTTGNVKRSTETVVCR